MYKKSIARIDKENDCSQTELSNPVLEDIIATNHVVLAKKPHNQRLSRACKAFIIMIILGLLSIGIIILTLVLAHSRNSLMNIIARSAEENLSSTSNNSRFLFMNKENRTSTTKTTTKVTTIDNEQTENEHWQETTVTLTTNNLRTLITQNVHISSMGIITNEKTEHISSMGIITNEKTEHISSTKPYQSSNIIRNDQSTKYTPIQTTESNQQTTNHFSTFITTEEIKLKTTMNSEEFTQTSTNSPTTTIEDQTSTLEKQDETSFTNLIDFQSSTITINDEKNQTSENKDLTNEDFFDDILFS